MWLEVINEVPERGTGFKACSPHVKFKSRKNSALFFDALLLRRESHLFCGDRIHIYILFFQIPITSSIFIFSRLSFPFASLSIQIKPVNYLANEEKFVNNVSYFTFGQFLQAQEKVIFDKHRCGLSYELFFRYLF